MKKLWIIITLLLLWNFWLTIKVYEPWPYLQRLCSVSDASKLACAAEERAGALVK